MGNFLALSSGGAGGTWTVILLYAGVIAGMYFLVIRPNSKKKKKEQKMRDSVQVGDDITTIGGIMGRVVSIKDDNQTMVIETGTDRAKIRIAKWALGSVDTVHEDEVVEKKEKEKK